MKTSKLLLLFIAALYCSSGFKLAEEAGTGKGIDFFKENWKEALAESKKTGKPIFVDVYAGWCGPCRQLKRTTFKDKEAGEYFNKNFINVSMDGETPEGEMLRKIYDVDSYPTLLIVNADGKLLTKTTGFMKPYILISFGRRIVPK